MDPNTISTRVIKETRMENAVNNQQAVSGEGVQSASNAAPTVDVPLAEPQVGDEYEDDHGQWWRVVSVEPPAQPGGLTTAEARAIAAPGGDFLPTADPPPVLPDEIVEKRAKAVDEAVPKVDEIHESAMAAASVYDPINKKITLLSPSPSPVLSGEALLEALLPGDHVVARINDVPFAAEFVAAVRQEGQPAQAIVKRPDGKEKTVLASTLSLS